MCSNDDSTGIWFLIRERCESFRHASLTAQSFVEAVEAAGITFLGPTPHQMTSMGLKHEARLVATKAGVPVVPGSGGVIDTLKEALKEAEVIGYPIMLKASAGGGGMGMSICKGERLLLSLTDQTDKQTLTRDFEATREKGLVSSRQMLC